jgi:hypothetical protein
MTIGDLVVTLRVGQGSAETHDAFYFLVSQREMSGDAVRVLNLCVAGDLMVSRSARTFFGRFDERSADALSLQLRLDVPALDERHR